MSESGSSSLAHASLGFVKMSFHWDWSGAEKEFKRAIELEPSYAQAHHWYAYNLIQLGRLDQAMAEAGADHGAIDRGCNRSSSVG